MTESETATVENNVDKNRFEIRAGGTVAGFADYHQYADLIAFTHTEISPDFGGRGLASQLIAYALDFAHERGMTVQPFCPFVRGYITKHPEYRALVNEAEWERFGLL